MASAKTPAERRRWCVRAAKGKYNGNTRDGARVLHATQEVTGESEREKDFLLPSLGPPFVTW